MDATQKLIISYHHFVFFWKAAIRSFTLIPPFTGGADDGCTAGVVIGDPFAFEVLLILLLTGIAFLAASPVGSFNSTIREVGILGASTFVEGDDVVVFCGEDFAAGNDGVL